MKKLFLSLGILMIVFASCHKEQKEQQLRTTSTLEQLKSFDNSYLAKNNNHNALEKQAPSPGWTIAFDAEGALGGCMLGPFGAFCGGLVASIGYAYNSDVIDNYTDSVSTNRANPYDIYGQMHNETTVFLVANNYYTASDGVTFSANKVIDSGKDYGINNYSTVLTEAADTVSNCKIKALTHIMDSLFSSNDTSYTDLLNAYENDNYITDNENRIMTEYLNTMLSVDNPTTYSIGAENIIYNSKDLSNSEIKGLLISMAVARNSNLLWKH